MFEDFNLIKLTAGLSSMSVTSNGVTFNKTAIMKLGKPEYVRLMMNEATQQLVIQVCEKDDENSNRFVRNRNNQILTARWNNKDLLYTLSKLMHWNLKEQGYRVDGEYIKEENAMIFDLNSATPI